MALVDNLHVERFKLIITFGTSIRAASIDDDSFALLTNDATPVELPGFEEIVLADDYDSIRRRLALYFADLPNSTGDYLLRLSGLVTTAGQTINEQDILFPYPYDNTDVEAPVEDPPVQDTEIVDKSIKADPFSVDSSNYVSNADFWIESSTPENDSVFVELDHNNGVLVVDFSEDVLPATIDDTHFAIQKKLLQTTGFSRWTGITSTQVAADGNDASKVEVSLPSTDATPVYDEAGSDYFESGYMYRLKIHPSVASATTTLGTYHEIIFATDVTPLYIDPEEIQSYYPEASLVEIMSLAYKYSAEVKRITENLEEIPDVGYEYILYAIQCALSGKYDAAIADGSSITLGNLSVSGGGRFRGVLNRGTAVSACEKAFVIKQELLRKARNSKAVVKGYRSTDKLPDRSLKYQTREF